MRIIRGNGIVYIEHCIMYILECFCFLCYMHICVTVFLFCMSVSQFSFLSASVSLHVCLSVLAVLLKQTFCHIITLINANLVFLQKFVHKICSEHEK